MKKRFTLTVGRQSQKELTRIARKLSLETNTAWDVQAAIVSCVNIGLRETMGRLYPNTKVPTIDT